MCLEPMSDIKSEYAERNGGWPSFCRRAGWADTILHEPLGNRRHRSRFENEKNRTFFCLPSGHFSAGCWISLLPFDNSISIPVNSNANLNFSRFLTAWHRIEQSIRTLNPPSILCAHNHSLLYSLMSISLPPSVRDVPGPSSVGDAPATLLGGREPSQHSVYRTREFEHIHGGIAQGLQLSKSSATTVTARGGSYPWSNLPASRNSVMSNP